uniref:Protoporphyrinogen oxidase n=1 Tax=Otus sunia TaxID=257818 RepID=A0A8C8B9R2_9STRI
DGEPGRGAGGLPAPARRRAALPRAPAPPVMLGGAWFEQSFGEAATPALLLQRAQAAVREQLGLEPAPTRCIVRVHQACIPQYTLGHWQRTERIGRFLAEQQLPLSLIGASYAGVSVNDCIASARAAVGRLLGQPR